MISCHIVYEKEDDRNDNDLCVRKTPEISGIDVLLRTSNGGEEVGDCHPDDSTDNEEWSCLTRTKKQVAR